MRINPYMAVWVMVASPVVTIDLAWRHHGFGVVDVVLTAGWWVVFAFSGFFPRLLYNVLQPQGPLAQLSQRPLDETASHTENPITDEQASDTEQDASEEMAKNTDAETSTSRAVLVHSDQVVSLRRWRNFLGAICVFRKRLHSHASLTCI